MSGFLGNTISKLTGKPKIIDNGNIRRYINYYINNKEKLYWKNLKNIPIGDWDVSHVTDMSRLFKLYSTFNEPLDKWDVRNVTNMSEMFYGCNSFNKPLNNWNVSKVENMNSMFYNCRSFNESINDWNVSKVTNMSNMFASCISFNESINDWNVSKVENMYSMFLNCINFNKPLNNWTVSNVENMSQMFYDCRKFNQPLSNWDVSKVENMNQMFYDCRKFNQPLNDWNVSKVENMIQMFYNCSSFYQPLNKWFRKINFINNHFINNTSIDKNKTYYLEQMFYNCPALEQFNNPELQPKPEPKPEPEPEPKSKQNNFWNDLFFGRPPLPTPPPPPRSTQRFPPPPPPLQLDFIKDKPVYIVPEGETRTLSDVIPKRLRRIEIHEEAKKNIKFKELNKFLSEKTGNTVVPNDLNFQSYINQIMTKLINETVNESKKLEQLNVVEQITNKRLNWIFKNNQLEPDTINSIFYCLNYVKSRSHIFKKTYIDSFITEYETKYNINNDVLSCLMGVIEEFVFALIPACNSDIENDDCTTIFMLVVGIDSFIADWFKLHPLDKNGKPVSLPSDKAGRRANLKQYLLTKLPEEEVIIREAIDALAEPTEFANEFFGETSNGETYNGETYNGEVSLAYPIQDENNNQIVEVPASYVIGNTDATLPRARFVGKSLGGTRRRRSKQNNKNNKNNNNKTNNNKTNRKTSRRKTSRRKTSRRKTIK